MTEKTFSKIYILASIMVALAFLFVFVAPVVSLAEDKDVASQEEKEAEADIIKTKKINGEICSIRPDHISILYAQDKKTYQEHEAMFLLNDEIEFKIRDYKELLVGDNVAITYDEYFKIEIDEKTGDEIERFVKRVTKEVRYLSSEPSGALTSK
ncbi:MAG: hypothetical protein V1727_06060 [Candidatus Omnitrophota bacterium]